MTSQEYRDIDGRIPMIVEPVTYRDKEEFLDHVVEVGNTQEASSLGIDLRCSICDEKFVDRGAHAAIDIFCYCKLRYIGKECLLTMLEGNHPASKRCPTCRHEFWEAPIQNEEIGWVGDNPPREQAYVHFVNMIERTGAILRCHSIPSFVDREYITRGYERGLISSNPDSSTPVRKHFLDKYRSRLSMNMKWRNAAMRAGLLAEGAQRRHAVFEVQDFWPLFFVFSDKVWKTFPPDNSLDTEKQDEIDRPFFIYRFHEILIYEFLSRYTEKEVTPCIRTIFHRFAIREIEKKHKEMTEELNAGPTDEPTDKPTHGSTHVLSDGPTASSNEVPSEGASSRKLPWTSQQQVKICMKVFDHFLMDAIGIALILHNHEAYILGRQRYRKKLAEERFQQRLLLAQMRGEQPPQRQVLTRYQQQEWRDAQLADLQGRRQRRLRYLGLDDTSTRAGPFESESEAEDEEDEDEDDNDDDDDESDEEDEEDQDGDQDEHETGEGEDDLVQFR